MDSNGEDVMLGGRSFCKLVIKVIDFYLDNMDLIPAGKYELPVPCPAFPSVSCVTLLLI